MNSTTSCATVLTLLALFVSLLLPAVGRNSLAASGTFFVAPSSPLDSLASTSTYYTIRRDLRRCVSPLCGGYFVKRVNRANALCADGRFAAECYVAEIDWKNQSAVDTQKALLRGTIDRKQYQRFGLMGVFKVSEAWQSPSNSGPSGVFYRVKDNGIRCITQPCLSYHEAKLNSTVSSNIAGVDLGSVGSSDDLISDAQSAMTRAGGIIVVGVHTLVTGPGGRAESLKASQFYLRPSESSSAKPCIKTGCSNQICAEENVVSTCEYRPEYECYQKARCERQPDGNCGFTKTRELAACLNRFKK